MYIRYIYVALSVGHFLLCVVSSLVARDQCACRRGANAWIHGWTTQLQAGRACRTAAGGGRAWASSDDVLATLGRSYAFVFCRVGSGSESYSDPSKNPWKDPAHLWY